MIFVQDSGIDEQMLRRNSNFDFSFTPSKSVLIFHPVYCLAFACQAECIHYIEAMNCEAGQRQTKLTTLLSMYELHR